MWRWFGVGQTLVALGMSVAACQVLGGINELHVDGAQGGAGGVGSAGNAAGTATGAGAGAGTGGSGGGVDALWSVRFGDATTQRVADVAVSPVDGRITVVGSFLGALDFGLGAPLVSAGDYDIFVATLSADGKPLWAVRFGGAGPDKANSVAISNNENPVVVGEFASTIVLPNKTLTSAGGNDVFVLKLSRDTGEALWGQSYGDAQDQRATAVAYDAAMSQIWLTGEFAGTLDCGAGGKVTAVGSPSVFLGKLTTFGACQSLAASGDSDLQSGTAVAVGPSSTLFLAAQFDGTLDLVGAGSQTSAGGGDVVLAKLVGEPVWSGRFGDALLQRPNAIAATADGGVLITGVFEGTSDAFGHAIVSKGMRDAFVGKIGGDGAGQWFQTFGDAIADAPIDDQEALDVATDTNGNIFVTGFAGGSVELGDGIARGGADVDLFFAALDSTGNTLWAMRRGGTDSQYGRAVAVDGQGHVILAGDFRGVLDLGNGPLTSAGSHDVFVAKLPIVP